jgi:cysteine-rich repeat protein
MICGKFENSAAFCTHRCNPSADECNSSNPDNCKWGEGVKVVDKCPEDAACVEWTPGTGAYYCLPQEKGCSSNYYNYSSSDLYCSAFAGKTKPVKPSTPTTDTKPYDNGHSCSSPSDCKSGNCENSKCADIVSSKKEDGEACTADSECKNGKCQKDNPSGSGKVCGEATVTLKEDGEACTGDAECKNGKCQKDNPDTSVGGKVCGDAEIAACGDANLDNGEACDDGNTVDGDGCSADCATVELGYECPTPGAKCLLALTSVCTDHSECASGRCAVDPNDAEKKTCQNKLDKDAVCLDDADCLDTLKCLDNATADGKVCSAPEPEKYEIGNACTSNEQCGSNCCAGEGEKVCAEASACATEPVDPT